LVGPGDALLKSKPCQLGVDTTSKTIILNQTTGSMVHTSYNKCLGVYTRVEEEEEEEGSTPGRDMR